MMSAVKQRAEQYDQWAMSVTETLEAKLEKKRGKTASEFEQKAQCDEFSVETRSVHLTSHPQCDVTLLRDDFGAATVDVMDNLLAKI